MSSQEPIEASLCEEGTEQPCAGETKKRGRKRRWGERLPRSTIEAKVRSNVAGIPAPEESRPPVHEDELSIKRYTDFRRGRSSSTCRYHQPTFETRHLDEWRCVVCYLWNPSERGRCGRCEATEGVDRVGDSIRDKVGDSIRRSDPRLEGRYPHGPRPHRHGHRNERKPTPPRTQGWPPLFETHGSDFVFDHRSNMFYESQSDFFYDPKSRLYYSNKTQAYFRYTNSKYPPFQQVTQSASSTETGQPRTVSNLPTNASSASPSTASKNEITVAVKSRSKSLSQSRDPSEETKAFSRERKDQLANIEKWTKKTNEVQISLKSRRYLARSTSEPPLDFEKRESRDREILESSFKESTSKYTAANHQMQTHKPTTAKRESRRSADPEESMVTKAVTHSTTKFSSKTSSGKLICRLCMRKFLTVEKLREHVQLSERHKAHLAKKEAEEAAAEEQKRPTVAPDVRSAHNKRQPATEYKDRALKRRLMYSDLMTSLPHRLGPSFLGGTNKKVRTAVVDPASTLGEHNVGNQLFQKMVSKANERGAAPIEPAVETLATSLTEKIRQDWERIESLSQRHTSSQGAGNTTGLGLGTKTSPWEGLDPRFP